MSSQEDALSGEANAISLIRPTPSVNSSLNSSSVNHSTAAVRDHDSERVRKHRSQRQNGLRHADDAVFAQRARVGRFVPDTVLREATLRVAAWADPTLTNIAPAWECRSVHPTDLADFRSTSHIALVTRTIHISLHMSRWK